MQKSLFVALSLLSLCLASLAQAQPQKNPVGTWAGSWTGGSNGTFEMTITKAADGKLGGSLTPKPENGEGYTATFTAVTLTAGKLTLKFNDPNGEVDIMLEATFEGTSLKGNYSVRAKADGGEVDRGTFTASKKP